MVMHASTPLFHADVSMMALHNGSGPPGAPQSFIVAAHPFRAIAWAAYHARISRCDRQRAGGPNAVKIEGARGTCTPCAALVEQADAGDGAPRSHAQACTNLVWATPACRARTSKDAHQICATEALALAEAGVFRPSSSQCVPAPSPG